MPNETRAAFASIALGWAIVFLNTSVASGESAKVAEARNLLQGLLTENAAIDQKLINAFFIGLQRGREVEASSCEQKLKERNALKKGSQ
jgi:hypothetical protein